MNRFTVFAALALASIGSASAGTFYHGMNGTASPVVAGGIVASNGSVGRGSGFSVTHPAPGHYVIKFTPGFFPTGCAAMVANPWAGRPLIANVAVTGCESKAPVFHVIVQRVDGILEDKHFSFVATGV